MPFGYLPAGEFGAAEIMRVEFNSNPSSYYFNNPSGSGMDDINAVLSGIRIKF